MKKSLLAEAKRFRKSIGTKNESSLHRTLKFQYTGRGGRSEVEVGEFVADGIRSDGEFIEVQTGSFAPLKKKVKEFTASSTRSVASSTRSAASVRIIHPIAVNKRIEVFSTEGKLLYKRKSPLHGSIWSVFDALLGAPTLPLTKGVIIEVILCDITEKRVKDGKGSWRRKGISIRDKELSILHESKVFSKPKDFLQFIPFKKGEEFTVSSLEKQAKINKSTAQKALYVLAKMNVVKKVGKKGRAWVYKR